MLFYQLKQDLTARFVTSLISHARRNFKLVASKVKLMRTWLAAHQNALPLHHLWLKVPKKRTKKFAPYGDN